MTIKEIAQLAGVSIATVSKIVNNKDQNINPETRSRVLEIVKEYNYTPYGTARTLSSAKTFILGVLMKDSSHNSEILKGIISSAKSYGYGVLIYDSFHSPTEELKHITALCRHKADGLLWEPVSPDSLQHEHYFSDADIPVTYINAPFTGDAFFIDYRKLGYLCTEKVLNFRHQNIGFLKNEDSLSSLEFFEGIKSCLFEHQIPLSDDLEINMKDGALPPSFTSGNYSAVICSQLNGALVLYRELDKLNYKVPSDLSLISVNVRKDAPSFPYISCYNAPFYSLGQKACEKLIYLCEKRETDTQDFTFDSDYTLSHEGSLSLPLSRRGRKFAILGSINVDVTLNVDGFPETGKSTLITNSSSCAGGKGTNQTIGTLRLGHEALVIGKVGNDAEANIIYDILTQNQLSTEGLYKDADAQTGKAYVYVQNGGEVTITYIPGANARLTAGNVRALKELFAGCEFCLLSMDIPMEAAAAAAALAKEYGVKTILKPSALSSLPDMFYHTTDIFVPNRQEAVTFCPHIDSVEEQAEFFYNQGMPVVIITLGHDGCFVRSEHLKKHIPAADFMAVDSTGGADAFICALAVHLSDGFGLEQAVRIAQYAAGFCISRQGVTSALIDKDTLYAHIRKTEPELLEKKF